MKQTYIVPVIHQVKGTQAVNANSYQEAVEFLLQNEKNLSIPNSYVPVEGTLRVDGEDVFGKNAEALANAHENMGVNTLPTSTALHATMFSDTITKL